MSCSSPRRIILHHLPQLPPDGHQYGTYFSRLAATHQSPHAPELHFTVTTSKNCI
ncbi:hypothetical protein KA405_05670 [Patescibacteria group bacterium]|nr:hypothetical protein [Patescibacteria group bacterium]